MNPAIYPILILLIVIFLWRIRKKKKYIMKKIIKSKRGKESCKMLELASSFIGQNCIIYLFDNQTTGVIKQVTSNALLIESSSGSEIVNLDFVVRIKEYPKNKKGKPKKVVM